MLLTLTYAAVFIGGALVLTGCGRDAGAGAAAVNVPAVVVLAPIQRTARALPIRTSGRLSAKAEIKLSFKIGGLIERLYADEGARIRSGVLLARLNLAEIDAQVVQAQSAWDKAQRDLGRTEGLHRDSVATLEQLQDARTGVEMAEAALRIAAFNRKHAEIMAPTGGRILKRTVEAGELVSPGQPVFLFGADLEGWIVRVGLADRDIVKLAVGDTASLSFDAYPGQRFSGRVAELADAADPVSGTFEVEIAVKDPDRQLKSGFIARVDLYPSESETVMLVPAEALVEGHGSEGIVYAYDTATGRAVKVPVQIARLLDREVALSSGLEAYDRVVTEGAGFLKDDQPVQVAAQSAP
jgi:RND family efflux transporter MFP subunit